MGITTKTVTTVTCDLCWKECGANDGEIRVQVTPGDGRDVGPCYAVAVIALDIPYQPSRGIVCRECKMKVLREYVRSDSAAGGQDE